MMSGPSFFVTDVATPERCRDLDTLQLMSRPLNDVATSSDSVLMSRPLLDVATSIFSLLKILCRDFYSVSRPPCLLFCIQFCRDLELVLRHLVLFFINLWLPDLEFLLRPYVILHHCQCVATICPFFLVHLTCCNIIQPFMSFLLSQFLLLLQQYPLSLEFPAA